MVSAVPVDNEARAEARTLLRALWTRTRIPMTRSNALAYGELILGLDPDRIRPAIEELIADGTVIAEGDTDDALLLWPGESRPSLGPRTVQEAQTLERLNQEASIPVRTQTPRWMLAKREPDPVPIAHKSIWISGALSFVFGPLGWLYAAPLKDVVVGFFVFSVLTTLAALVLPGSLAAIVGGLASFVSGVLGMSYAHQYNKRGKRTALLDAKTNA
jgi:hypothetical protein